jgi:hypothetical protein
MPITKTLQLPPTSCAFPAVDADQPVTQCVHGFVWDGATATVTASITAGQPYFTINSIAVSDMVTTTEGEGDTGPSGKPLPIVRVVSPGPPVATSNGATPLTIETGQYVALNVTFDVPDAQAPAPGSVSGTCELLLQGGAPGSSWTGNLSGGYNPPAATPGAGLGSNSNYVLTNNCNPMLGVSVTITVTEDMVFESASAKVEGFGFQLNAYSPKNELCAAQQYAVALLGSELYAIVENWKEGSPLFTKFMELMPIEGLKIPAGYVITISLQNDAHDNINGVTFDVTDNHGNNVTVQKALESIGATAQDLAPIVGFQLDIVGPENGESAVLSSGAGTIDYQAAQPMTVLPWMPSCVQWDAVTEETANTFYGQLTALPASTFEQSFNVGSAKEMKRATSPSGYRRTLPPPQ